MAELSTEAINQDTSNLDQMTTLQMVMAMHRADGEAWAAVSGILPAISQAVDAIAERLANGGRLFYLGAGTSGRLGVLDASECPPTFHSPPELVQAVIAGGDAALRHAIEGAEDDETRAALDLAERAFTGSDVLVGIAASGRTPYVLGGLEHANKLGALTIGLTCVAGSAVAKLAHLSLIAQTGAEVVAGSTRLKAGTATKMILNMLSTGVMVKLGNTYGNLMVNVQPTNQKLQARAVNLVASIAGIEPESAGALLHEAGSVKTAVVMRRLKVSREDAELRLAQAGGRLGAALSTLA